MHAPSDRVIEAAPPPREASGAASAGSHRAPGGPTALRVLCHLVVELPVALFGVVELAHGWRPLSDNAALSLRSWQVLTAQSPLVGHQMAVSVGSRAVFGPGPLQSWILAVPVHLDPTRGALWGGVLAVLVAMALAVEAAWRTDGWRAAVVTSGALLVLGIVRSEVVLDVVWNVWFAVLFLITAFAAARATAAGRLRWWPVTVVASSVVVQCQAAFAPPAVALCVMAPVLGLLVRRRRQERPGWPWLAGGLGIGVVVWSAPLVEQARDHPGNLTLLARASDAGPVVGVAAGLRALGAATRPDPTWIHRLPTGSAATRFFGIAGLVDGAEWWGVTVLGLLLVTGVVAWRSGRVSLSGMAWLTLALAGGTVVTIASVPTSQFVVVGYLGVLLAPTGMAVAVTLAWAVGDGLLSVVRRVARTGPSGERSRWTHGTGWPTWIAAGTLVGLSGWLVIVGMGQVGGVEPTLVGWSAARVTDAATTAAARVAPQGSFRLEVRGGTDVDVFAVEGGVADLLVAKGFDARPDDPVAYPTFGRPPPEGPTVVVTLSAAGHGVEARLVPASGGSGG